MQGINLSKAYIRPQGPAQADSFVTIIYPYTAGHSIDDTGSLKIVFRQVTDFGAPKFEYPARPNYCTVHINDNCHIESRGGIKRNTRL